MDNSAALAVTSYFRPGARAHHVVGITALKQFLPYSCALRAWLAIRISSGYCHALRTIPRRDFHPLLNVR